MTIYLTPYGWVSMRCALVVLSLCWSIAISARPAITLPAPGQFRVWLEDEYILDAHFELKFGRVAVWQPVGGYSPGPLVEFAGLIDDESARVLGELLRKGRVHTLSIAGPGGFVAPTLVLGQALRAQRVTTVVEAGRGCYSACALLFLAGDVRIIGDERTKPLNPPAGEVGFHSPYVVGADGKSRYMQDVKSSSTCAYFKKMLSAQAAIELCDYTLATKGMATFSVDAGKRLQIYTDSESDVLSRLVALWEENSTPDERHWITCERFRLHRMTPLGRLSQSTWKHFSPCSEWRAPPVPAPEARLRALTKTARILGPSKPSQDDYRRTHKELAERLLKAGLSTDEQHYVDCNRSSAWLTQQGKHFTFSAQQPYTAEYVIWERSCRYSLLPPMSRMLEGVGSISEGELSVLLSMVALDQGPSWPPPEPRKIR